MGSRLYIARTVLKNMSADKMSVPYKQYMANQASKAYANSGHNSIKSNTLQYVDPSVNNNALARSNINLNIVVPSIDNNGIQSQAQAQAQEQYCGGEDCNKDCCKPVLCPPKKVVCKEYKCKEVCVCKPKCEKYEYVIKKPKDDCHKKKSKCFDYCDDDSSWYYSKSYSKCGKKNCHSC